MPHPSLQHFRWLPTGVRDRVAKACLLPKGFGVAKEFFGLVETAWGRLHTSTQGDAEVRKKMQGIPPVPRPCNAAGMCICDVAGKQLCRMGKALDGHLAALCPRGPQERQTLSHCELVVFFVGRSQELMVATSGAADGASTSASDLSGELLVGHISDQSLSPWESWYQKGSTDDSFDFKALRFHREEVRIHVRGEFWRRYFWLDQLDRTLHWSI